MASTQDLSGLKEYLELDQNEQKELLASTEVSPTNTRGATDWMDDPRAKEVYTFQFDWQDARGRYYTGGFTTKILNENERNMVDIHLAKLCGGVPYGSLPPGRHEMNYIRAHLTYSLIDAPPWAKDLGKLSDPSLILQIWAHVEDHASFFFGTDAYAQTSEEADGDGGSGA